MDMKRQEVARVQMGITVAGATQDALHELSEAKAFTGYSERLKAWERALENVKLGRDTLAAYMRNYGLLGEA